MKLTRRSMLALTGAMAGMAVSGNERDEVPAEVAAIPIPEYVDAMIEETLARFLRWKGSEETVAFPIITDVHSESEPIMKVPKGGMDFWDTKLQMLYAIRAAKRFNTDFIADLGDIGMDRWTKGGLPSWDEHMKPRMELQYRLYAGVGRPVLFAVGNHDLGNPRTKITRAEWGRRFNLRQRAERMGATELCPEGDFGWLDLPAKRTRIIFLDTSSSAPMGKGIIAEQCEWLAKALDSVPSSWRLVVLSHICLHRNIGRWLPEPLTRPDGAGFAQTRSLLENWAAKRKVPVFAFSGDSHFNNEICERGVTYAITQGCGTVPWQMLPPESRYELVDKAHSMLVDVVAMKVRTGEVKMFRIGNGGEAADRDLSRNANHGARKFAFVGNSARIEVPGISQTLEFKVQTGDAKAKDMKAEVRDGLRFVWIDNRGGEVSQTQFDFFNREAAKPEPLALILSVPLYVPGLNVAEAPCAHNEWKMPPDHPEINKRVGWLGGGHSYTTFYFRWRVSHAARMVGVFAAYGNVAFAASEDGVFECVVPGNEVLGVRVN